MLNIFRHLWPVVCLPAVFLLVGCGDSHATPQAAPKMKPPEVSVSAVVADTVTDYEDFPGHLEAINSIDIRARVTGFITKVNFEEGKIVKKDAVLFEIDARPYKAELDRTEGIVLQMQGRLKRLESDFKRAETLLPKQRHQPGRLRQNHRRSHGSRGQFEGGQGQQGNGELEVEAGPR